MADGWLIKGEGSFEQLVDDQGRAHVVVKSTDIASSALQSEYDQVSDVLAYSGVALPGTATSAAGWQIMELTFNAAGDVSGRFADSDGELNNVWDDRAGLTYS